jgi:hypothetical protein
MKVHLWDLDSSGFSACATASRRERTFNFNKMLWTCIFTVPGEMRNAVPISLLLFPADNRRSTCSSRVVNVALFFKLDIALESGQADICGSESNHDNSPSLPQVK